MRRDRRRRRSEVAGGWRRRLPLLEHLESRRLLASSVNIATFPLRGEGTYPEGIATGAGTDTNIWFTLSGNHGNIGMINPNDPGTGVVQYAIPTNSSGPGPIAAGPDGNYWFFEESANQFAVINPTTGQDHRDSPAHDHGPPGRGDDRRSERDGLVHRVQLGPGRDDRHFQRSDHRSFPCPPRAPSRTGSQKVRTATCGSLRQVPTRSG